MILGQEDPSKTNGSVWTYSISCSIKAKLIQNLFPQYSWMLLASTLNRLLRAWDSGLLDSASPHLEHLVSVTLIQVMNRTLMDQSPDGSWGDKSVEVTAYAVLCLASVSPFPWTLSVRDQISFALERGQQFISRSREGWVEPQHVWSKKSVMVRLYFSGRIALRQCTSKLRRENGGTRSLSL